MKSRMDITAKRGILGVVEEAGSQINMNATRDTK